MKKLDLVLCLAFGAFAASTFTVDLWAVTGWIHGDNALAHAFHGYNASVDPLFGVMPFYVRALMIVSLFAFGPMDVLVVYAFVRRREWIRVPALVFAGAQMTAMTTYFLIEALGDIPPLNWPALVAANGPYLVFPALLLVRLRRAPVFD